jgi:hypothetical protein
MYGTQIDTAKEHKADKRTPSGLCELYSTVVVRSRRPAELQAFTTSIGRPMPGEPSEKPQNRLGTNMRVDAQCLDEAKEAVGIEWTIPAVVGRCAMGDALRPEDDPYHVRLTDVIEFARTAMLRVYLGGQEAFAEWPPIGKPITWGVEGARQRIRFNDPVAIGKVERFRVEVGFPGDAPIFGRTGPGGQEREASIPVTFRFLEAGDMGQEFSLSSVQDAIAAARQIQADAVAGALKIQEESTRTMREINMRLPPHGVDPAVLSELAEMRKGCDTDAELVDLLRAVRQGIRTR